MKKIYLIFIVFIIFFISVAVRYWPIYHKGHSYNVAFENLILARNLNLTGEYKISNEKNVILSSLAVSDSGIISQFGNKLTPVLYSKLFKVFGLNFEIPLIISLALYGFISVLLFILILKLFNLCVALIFSFIEIFSPLVLQRAIEVGTYEWAMFFLTIGIFIYLYKEKPNLLKLFFAGLFFALASLARNSFLILPFIFLLYDFYKNKSLKRIAIFILPILILWGVYLGPSFLEKDKTTNVYLTSQDTSGAYMHLFPDPYTWYFERDSYVKSIIGTTNYDYNQFLIKYGYPVSLKNRILMYFASIKSYPKGLLDQTTVGGPFMIFFLFLGGFYLFRNKKDFIKLFIVWGGLLYVFLVTLKSNHWGHFIALQLPLFLLISLGIYWIFKFVLKQGFKTYLKYAFVFGFILVLFIHLVQSDKWMFHEQYENSNTGQALELVKAIEEQGNYLNKKQDIIAVGLYNQAPMLLNWYTDYSFVYFDPNTVKKLLEENKLKWAFEQFGVTKFTGYDKELTEEIIESTGAVQI